MTFDEVRRLFPGAEQRVHLDAAAVSITSTRAVQAIERFLAVITRDAVAAHRGDDAPRARQAAARMIGARPEQIALSPATTLALNVAADAVPIKRGDNVVTCNLEFMSVIVPWLEKCRAAGAELRVVKHEAGRVSADAVIAQLDADTRAVVLSSVQWTNGYRLDIRPIGQECRRRGIPFIVDAIQQLGILPLDVVDCAVDYLACGGHKWLASPTALGFVYASDAFTARFRPTLTYAADRRAADRGLAGELDGSGLRSHPDVRPQAGRRAVRDRRPPRGAVRGRAGRRPRHLRGGRARAGSRPTRWRLGDRAAAGLRGAGPRGGDPPRAGASVRPHRVPRRPRSREDDLALRDHLLARDIAVSVRYTSGIGGVRISTHFYNNEADVDRLLDAVRSLGADALSVPDSGRARTRPGGQGTTLFTRTKSPPSTRKMLTGAPRCPPWRRT